MTRLRGTDRNQSTAFSYLSPEKRVQMLARKLGLPEPEVGPDFLAFAKALGMR